ncbi:MAG: hypothetical protein CMM56_05020 [Rhodospirillaceae bacterium]|nr:hypothetical protein [Rhodospirillaceae bacterium]|tara:strand:+ start:566 stop:1039 length:474 start_codon:yes stop_codon:yes gene_type:complete
MIHKLPINSQVFTALLMTLIFLFMSLFSITFPGSSKLMPLLIGIPGTILALLQLYREIQLSINSNQEEQTKINKSKSAENKMLFWMFLFIVGVLGFGFTYATPILVFSFLFVGSKESFLVSISGAIGAWLLVFGLFELIFEIPLFNGLIIMWLVGSG